MCLPPDKGPGREIVYPGSLRRDEVEYISFDNTDFLQAERHFALACPADLETSSAALRYVLRECGREQWFSLRPQVGEILTLTPSITSKPSQTIHLMITRAFMITTCATDRRRPSAMPEKANTVAGGPGNLPHLFSHTAL